MSVGWSFQVVTDGSFQGFNEPGIAHFKGDRYGNLAREIIQNSLDAAANETETVYVEFNLQKIPPDKIPGFAEFVKHVEMCAAEEGNQESHGAKAYKFFKNALNLARKNTINVLEIAESNTKGMTGPCEIGTPYHAFLKASGQSEKGKGAGGSHGIGKNASLAVSDFRTIFVSTCWDDGNGAERRYVQGRTTLTTHSSDGERVGSVGYWGVVDGCYPLEDPSVADGDIPDWLERDTRGTSIFIIGFQRKKNWAENLIAAVAQNFFCSNITRKTRGGS